MDKKVLGWMSFLWIIIKEHKLLIKLAGKIEDLNMHIDGQEHLEKCWLPCYKWIYWWRAQNLVYAKGVRVYW